ncbi:hypothetical protein [Micromonospora orduensis]
MRANGVRATMFNVGADPSSTRDAAGSSATVTRASPEPVLERTR